MRHRPTLVFAAIVLATLALVPVLHALGVALPIVPQDLSAAHGTATTALHDAAQQASVVDDLIARMSLDEEIGQLLVTGVSSDRMTPDLATKIQRYHVGGAILASE